MILRAGRVSPVCLLCRLSLSKRRNVVPVARFGNRPILAERQQRYASDWSAQPKAPASPPSVTDPDESLDVGSEHSDHDSTSDETWTKNTVRGRPSEDVWHTGSQESALSSRHSQNSIEGSHDRYDDPFDGDSTYPKSRDGGDLGFSLQEKATEAPAPREFRHSLLRQKSLGVDSLGQPMDALVLKNPNTLERPPRGEPIEVKGEIRPPPVNLHWEDVVASKETTSEFSKEVLDNIDELRPTDSPVILKKDFDSLRDALVDGFTKNQLAHYFNETKHGNKPIPDESGSYPWLVRRSPWTAADPIQWKSMTPKQHHALLIMQVVWGLEIQDHTEGLGTTQLWLRPSVFRLVARSSSPAWNSLKENFLDEANNEAITADFEESRLDIYTRKSTVPAISIRLDEILRAVVSRKISAEHIAEEHLDEAILEELGRTTNTSIQYDKDTQELDVTWLSDQDRTIRDTAGASEFSEIEDPADVVFRLLINRSPNWLNKEIFMVMPRQGSENRLTDFVPHHREVRSMAWRDKLRAWTRYVSPIYKPSKVQPPRRQVKRKLDMEEPNVELPEGTEFFHRITATYGHLLHDVPKIQKKKLAKNRRILSPVVPHPAALTSVVEAKDAVVQQSSAIVLNFIPNPTGIDKEHDRAPPVQLRLPVHQDTILSEFTTPADSTLTAVVPWNLVDFMLPGESVDVRVTQQVFVSLDMEQQPLKDFLASCDFNLLQGRLRTPSAAYFYLPPQLLSSNPLPMTESTEPVKVPYLFTGLEIQQTTNVNRDRYELQYNSIEAGHHGGQRQELSIYRNNPEKKFMNGRFLKVVDGLSRGQSWFWVDGQRLMRPKAEWEHLLDEEVYDMEEEERQIRSESEDQIEDAEQYGAVDETSPLDDSEVVEQSQPVDMVTEPEEISHEEPAVKGDGAGLSEDPIATKGQQVEKPAARKHRQTRRGKAPSAKNGKQAKESAKGDRREKGGGDDMFSRLRRQRRA